LLVADNNQREMIMKILQRIERLVLMASYATKVVYAEGSKELNSSKLYQPLLKCTHLSASGGDSEAISWSTSNRLDKLIDGRQIYITLVEWSDVECSPEYSWYELKSDMDQCGAAINIKRKLRDMIKNPQKYINVGH